MARYVEIHPENPQTRLIEMVVERLRQGEVIAFPTDSGYAIGCKLGNKEGLDRIRAIRRVSDKHHFTMLCHDFAQLGQFVIVDNAQFRLIKQLTPGPYTFILKGTKDVPRMTLHPKKNTVGVRLPKHEITQALVAALGEPLLSSTLILPDEEEPMTDGWEVNEALGHALDIVIEGPVGVDGATTVVDMSSGFAEVVREGAGSTEMFE
ncbi:L-threonylcarbamoyladenylate synthase [Flaviflexus equikiangi]|uniref:Threonylcarbamoyl-AMP synthase n=1 Tax=Flaviflexus equikiangi TaxID=2758573 RepID=A0ABS2TEV7_9ACTO|nr:L-threonylcarbamoyladenylate synthase [Flaviflexus equikiangi]MBM9433200.1 threonylcarbamoyl-AMP synthase [Flaviflexus equikiangi]